MYQPNLSASDANPDVTYAVLDYTTSNMQFLAPVAGTYLVNVVITVVALGAVVATDGAFLQVVDDSVAANIGPEQVITGLVSGEHRQLSITAIVVTDSDNHQISIYGKQTVLGHMHYQAIRSVMTWVRLE
jgi:hypothetical protein